MGKHTITDDYGNLVYKTKNKTISADSLSGAKHRLKTQRRKLITSAIGSKPVSKELRGKASKLAAFDIKSTNQLVKSDKTSGKQKWQHYVKSGLAQQTARSKEAQLSGKIAPKFGQRRAQATKVLKRLRRK